MTTQVANVAMLANGTRPLSDLATEITIDGGATLFDAYSSEDSFRLEFCRPTAITRKFARLSTSRTT